LLYGKAESTVELYSVAGNPKGAACEAEYDDVEKIAATPSLARQGVIRANPNFCVPTAATNLPIVRTF
jgi:hypothetical protein